MRYGVNTAKAEHHIANQLMQHVDLPSSLSIRFHWSEQGVVVEVRTWAGEIHRRSVPIEFLQKQFPIEPVWGMP